MAISAISLYRKYSVQWMSNILYLLKLIEYEFINNYLVSRSNFSYIFLRTEANFREKITQGNTLLMSSHMCLYIKKLFTVEILNYTRIFSFLYKCVVYVHFPNINTDTRRLRKEV